jgi:hypothetical protein
VIALSQNLKGITRRLEETFAGRCGAAFIDLQGIDRAMVIASQALTALIPSSSWSRPWRRRIAAMSSPKASSAGSTSTGAPPTP